MTFVKFCGMTRIEDVTLACALGVDAIGFVLWAKSPRGVGVNRVASLVRVLPPDVTPVGVFVAATEEEIRRATEAGIRVVQIHGGGDRGWVAPAPIWMATSTEVDLSSTPEDVTLLLDTQDPDRHGGSGRTINWDRAAEIAARRRVMLAGGLTPANVAQAIRQVRPYGVDVASGIEERPGVKNAQAMKAFIAAVREADQ